jgi:hypothetical protein
MNSRHWMALGQRQLKVVLIKCCLCARGWRNHFGSTAPPWGRVLVGILVSSSLRCLASVLEIGSLLPFLFVFSSLALCLLIERIDQFLCMCHITFRYPLIIFCSQSFHLTLYHKLPCSHALPGSLQLPIPLHPRSVLEVGETPVRLLCGGMVPTRRHGTHCGSWTWQVSEFCMLENPLAHQFGKVPSCAVTSFY